MKAKDHGAIWVLNTSTLWEWKANMSWYEGTKEQCLLCVGESYVNTTHLPPWTRSLIVYDLLFWFSLVSFTFVFLGVEGGFPSLQVYLINKSVQGGLLVDDL